MRSKIWLLSALVLLASVAGADETPKPPGPRPVDPVEGLYKAVLKHKDGKFFQTADITLRTTNPSGSAMKISANVRLFFGGFDSKEFLTYEFDVCELNPFTRQLTIKSEKNDVSFIGYLRNGTFDGDWFATVIGRAGTFTSLKNVAPKPPADGVLISTLTGHYRGPLTEAMGDLKATERVSMALVTVPDTSGTATGSNVKITGSVRLYMGEFGSIEYWEYKLADINFNFYNRYFTAKTVSDPEMTFRGTVSHEGVFSGVVFGSPGEGKVELKRTVGVRSENAARFADFDRLSAFADGRESVNE